MTYRFFVFIPSTILACIPMEPLDGQNGVTFPTPPAIECQEITKGTTDVILTPSGTQVDQTTVTASCPAGKRLKIDNQLQTGATGTITCSAGAWLDGSTAVTMVSCVPECQEITKGTTDVILTPSGTQLDQTTVTVSCPAGTRVKIDNQVLLPGATGTLTCLAGGWLDGTTTVTMVSCDPVCNQTPTELSGYFYSISTGSNWMNAEQDCYSKGGHLFSVQSQADNDFLLSLTSICSPGSLWIGGHRYLSNPPFAWTDNSPFVYTNWATGRPDTGASTTHCILFNSPSGEWTDADCYSLSSFVCRYSSLTPTIQMSPATCPAGWSAMTLCGTSACYLCPIGIATWADAEAACQAFGVNAHLASVHCAAEQNFIKGILPPAFNDNRAWIGGFRTGGVTMFSWIDGTPFNYVDFTPPEPNNFFSVEFCSETFGLTRPTINWNDLPCSNPDNYVCKIVL